MNDLHNQTAVKSLKEVPKWTRRYAQNRPAAFLLFLTIFFALFIVIGGSSYVGAYAYRSGNTPLFGGAMVALALGLGFCLWFSNPWWGGRWLERAAKWIYAAEGEVTLASPKAEKNPGLLYAVTAGFILCVILEVQLGLAGFFPLDYMQPISALFVVPFVVFISFWTRPMAGWIPFLWPILYGAHAILVVAGAPIQFDAEGKGGFLNMLIPIAGYGLLCGLIGQIYGRFALKKLKALVVEKS